MIDINQPREEYFDELMSMRYSRIPVYEDEYDEIIGILNIKDYLIEARKQGFDNVDIRPILRDPLFVPETKNIDSLFMEMKMDIHIELFIFNCSLFIQFYSYIIHSIHVDLFKIFRIAFDICIMYFIFTTAL